MRYLLLLYDNETEGAKYAEEEMPAWFTYTDEMRAAGKMLGGEALHPTESATTVRGQSGKIVTMDGPFAETKEQLGGYYLIEAKDIEEALEWARRAPHVARGGSCEVRPIMEFEDM